MEDSSSYDNEAREVAELYKTLVAPGTNHVYGCVDVAVVEDGRAVILNGLSFEGGLEDGPTSKLYSASLDGGSSLRALADGVQGRLPRAHVGSGRLAWVVPGDGGGSDIVLSDGLDGERRRVAVPGLVEDLAWSADGDTLLAVVAGLGADLAGYQGGYATKAQQNGPAWRPAVSNGKEQNLWRSAWSYTPATDTLEKISSDATNVWEASWCGDCIAVIASDRHSEGAWYQASLRTINVWDRSEHIVYRPDDCLGLPRGSIDGSRIAFVEAVASDRGIICGILKILDLSGGRISTPDTDGVEVTSVSWADNDVLHYAGQNGDRTFLGSFDTRAGVNHPIWESRELTCGQWYPFSYPLGPDAALAVVESFDTSPRLCVARNGKLETVHDFGAPGAAALAASLGRAETVNWQAPDGQTIFGVLLRPHHLDGPAPFVLDIHGGPVWANRNRWIVNSRTTPLLLRRGYCVLYPNPRGSATYGQDFARLVKGDMGGGDTHDFTSALDHFIDIGLADPHRLACTGTSYGGFMSSWLVTQDNRFAAAAPVSPVINWLSQHWTSQIPYFDELFLESSPFDVTGRHVTRSPVMFSDRVRTPTLLLAGALDKNTPPTQALEFHNALLEHGVETTIVTYPEGGHSLRGYPAYLDSAARILVWFERHLNSAGTA